MATKKTTRKTPAKKNGVKKTTRKAPGRKPRKDAKSLHPRRLSGKLFYEFKAKATELELLRQKMENCRVELLALSKDSVHDPVFLLLGKEKSVAADIKEAIVEFAEVQKKIADKFGIPFEKLHEYTFDTDTGKITPSALPPPKT